MRSLRWAPPVFYFLLVLAALAYLEYRIHFDPGNSEVPALPLIVLALPWSIVIPWTVGIQNVSSMLGWAALVGGILVNAFIMNHMGMFLSRATRAEEDSQDLLL